MNAITEKAIQEAGSQHRRLVEKIMEGDPRALEAFSFYVGEAYWAEMISEHGVDLKERALHLLRLSHRECFDEEGYLTLEGEAEYEISEVTMRCLQRRIDADPALQLAPFEEYANYLLMLYQPVPQMVQAAMF